MVQCGTSFMHESILSIISFISSLERPEFAPRSDSAAPSKKAPDGTTLGMLSNAVGIALKGRSPAGHTNV